MTKILSNAFFLELPTDKEEGFQKCPRCCRTGKGASHWWTANRKQTVWPQSESSPENKEKGGKERREQSANISYANCSIQVEGTM